MKKTNGVDCGKVLVTGGGGYIGTVLAQELLAKGYSVRLLDTFYWGNEPIRHLQDRVEVVNADIRDVGVDVLKGVSAVIHQAGLSNDPMAEFDTVANFEINTDATVRFAKLCKEYGVSTFTFASSASIYDRGLLAQDDIQNEDSKVNPKAAYSLSKFKAEQKLLELKSSTFSPVVMRQGTVYGFSPRLRYDLVVNTMLKSALLYNKLVVFCGGEQWRPLIDVRDVALAHIAAIEAPQDKVRGEIFNLVYKNYRVLELAHWIRKALRETKNLNPEIEIDYSPRKDRSYRISGEKIRKTIGWEPKISVEESIKDMILNVEKWKYTDYLHPRYYNIEWMKLLCTIAEIVKDKKRIF